MEGTAAVVIPQGYAIGPQFKKGDFMKYGEMLDSTVELVRNRDFLISCQCFWYRMLQKILKSFVKFC